MDYPSGHWKICEYCRKDYFRYDDNTGGCDNPDCPPRVEEREEYQRQKKRDAKLKRLERENKKLKEKIKLNPQTNEQ